MVDAPNITAFKGSLDKVKACPHWQQKSPKTETKSIRSSSPYFLSVWTGLKAFYGLIIRLALGPMGRLALL